MRLKNLYVYPVKSLGGMRVSSAEIRPPGIRYDRRWMLVDKAGKFLSQRSMPSMATLQANVVPERAKLVVYPKITPDDRLEISFSSALPQKKAVSVWEDTVWASAFPKEINQWFSDRLETTCELVYMSDEHSRSFASSTHDSNGFVSFADSCPYLLASEDSLADLNNRLADPVPMDRFRPNLVIEGASPFAEDTWKEIRIGEISFEVVKPCARCVITTTDQQTGEVGKEPLRTLASYRLHGNKVMFGQNLVAHGSGLISEGDAIVIA